MSPDGITEQNSEDRRVQSHLAELLNRGERFAIGAELVTTRGSVHQPQTRKILRLSSFLSEFDQIDFVSITDNPGGSARISPDSLGVDLSYRGKEVVIHLSCKDNNRNGLESRAWKLANEGLNNILSLSGDYPVEGYGGLAKGVFDIDSIGLLKMLREMNEGYRIPGKSGGILANTNFFLGAAVTNFKRYENEVMPQYFKLEKKVSAGAQFLITQLGFDSRKFDELLHYIRYRELEIPVIANIYVLSLGAAKAFYRDRIPGCVVTQEFLSTIEEHAKSPDKGARYFLELAAQQLAVARGLGYQGAYLGGIHEPKDFEIVLRIANSFAEDDWKQFARVIQFAQPDEFYFFEQDPVTGLSDPKCINAEYLESTGPEGRAKLKHSTPVLYKINRGLHHQVFDQKGGLFRAGRAIYSKLEKSSSRKQIAHKAEQIAKSILFDCRDCGDCSLPDIAYLCPESQCAKNQRNGPCGGTRQGLCEVYDKPCIWSLAYDRLKPYGEEASFVTQDVVIKDCSLQGTSAWGNTFAGRDHNTKESDPTDQDSATLTSNISVEEKNGT